MPKTKLDKFSKHEDPPIDWLWAAVLERMRVKKIDLKGLSKAAGCSYESMRRYINESPWNWPRGVREGVCKHLGVGFTVTPGMIELEGMK